LWRRGKMLRASHTRAQAGPIRRRGQGWWRPPGPSPISAAVSVIVASWFPFRRWITFLRYFCNWRYILPNWEGLNKLAINLIAGLKGQP
jgi:hypothetical protein